VAWDGGGDVPGIDCLDSVLALREEREEAALRASIRIF
jgi:hypothetical protein